MTDWVVCGWAVAGICECTHAVVVLTHMVTNVQSGHRAHRRVELLLHRRSIDLVDNYIEAQLFRQSRHLELPTPHSVFRHRFKILFDRFVILDVKLEKL